MRVVILSAQLLLLTGMAFLLLSSKNVSAQTINTLVNPPCTNTVCVDIDMHDITQHDALIRDLLPSFYMELHHQVPCGEPQPTGVTVHKQIAAAIAPFPDTVCLNQGCTPSAPPFRSGTGPGGTTTPPRECR